MKRIVAVSATPGAERLQLPHRLRVRLAAAAVALAASSAGAVTGAASASASPAAGESPSATTSAATATTLAAAITPAQSAALWHARESKYFQRTWGVDIDSVRLVSSGWMLSFKYRVLDPKKAAPLAAKTAKPFLIDEATGARLAVPAMENIGELRQATALQADRSYFVIFGNPNNLVKRGGRVSVVIGDFRVDGLTVQ